MAPTSQGCSPGTWHTWATGGPAARMTVCTLMASTPGPCPPALLGALHQPSLSVGTCRAAAHTPAPRPSWASDTVHTGGHPGWAWLLRSAPSLGLRGASSSPAYFAQARLCISTHRLLLSQMPRLSDLQVWEPCLWCQDHLLQEAFLGFSCPLNS